MVNLKGKGCSSPPNQPTLSAFFSQVPSPSTFKRRNGPNSPIDLTNDDDDEPPAKKFKLNASKSFTAGSEPSSSTVPRRGTQWDFSPSQPGILQPKELLNNGTTTLRQKRHEEFKRVLLSENSRSLQRKRTIPNHTDDSVHGEEEQDAARDSGDDSDPQFRQLTALFASKSSSAKGKGKAPASASVKKGEEIGPSGLPYTPQEKQALQFIKANPGTVLMIEIGYKYYFYEESAKIASQELGIVCYMRRNLWAATIPSPRRDVHLKKLLAKGHRVGIVEQIETAALKKASDNRNTLFERKLTHLYTATTYVDELNSVDELERYNAPPLMCLIETVKNPSSPTEQTVAALISISPSTGDVVWDEFDDNHLRTEMETRLVHTRPAELLLPESGLSRSTEKMLTHFTQSASENHKIRVERFKDMMSYTDAFEFVSDFYTDKSKSSEGDFAPDKLMMSIADFSQQVVVVLAHAIQYLAKFSIADAFLGTRFFTRFTTRAHMLLDGNTLTNLEIYRNETDFTIKGSLLWILDHTTTKFGARLLKNWVGRPLTDLCILRERSQAVEEIISSSSEVLVSLRQVLKKLPDLAKGLSRIQYAQCTPRELVVLLKAFKKIGGAFDDLHGPVDTFRSKLLNDIVAYLPQLNDPIQELLNCISLKQANEDRKEHMWANLDKYPVLTEIDRAISRVEADLNDELKSIRKLLHKPSLQWTSCAGEEYLIEVKRNENLDIPVNWHIMSRTKFLTRYHTPHVKKKLQERAQYKEALEAEASKAYAAFLTDISQDHYSLLRDTVNKLALADCLLSFAHVALQEGYVRPEFTDEDTFVIEEGRHPMVEVLRSDPFVPNTVHMGGEGHRSKIITGPNMGGKSSAVRMIGLIAIMAQIGSYVPAKSVKLGMIDGILTRMGASDELARGRSTFMVEMFETSDILRTATRNSLVILDELGRGTSTVDGMAIADAVLQYLVETVQCKTLFITHYPLVASDLEKRFPLDIENLHMGYTEETRVDGTREITFLYKLTAGAAVESFGAECARLAGVPESIVSVAIECSNKYRSQVEERSKRNRAKRLVRLLQGCLAGDTASRAAFSRLRSVANSMFLDEQSPCHD